VPRGQEQRDQHDRAELPDRANREQIRPESGLQLARVRQDRDQRSHRRRRHRRARVQQRQHNAGGRQRRPDPERKRERRHPHERRKLERPPANPVEVDLVPREEEQHRQAEIPEEVRELIDLRDPGNLRPDHDPEQQLDHHHRNDQPPFKHRAQDTGGGGSHDDDEKRRRIDLAHR